MEKKKYGSCVCTHNYIANTKLNNDIAKRFVYFDALDKYKEKSMKENRYYNLFRVQLPTQCSLHLGYYEKHKMKSKHESKRRDTASAQINSEHAIKFPFDGK